MMDWGYTPALVIPHGKPTEAEHKSGDFKEENHA